ncbi:ras-related protein Rab-17-like [Megalops cyprinoides]|uniref:ras-related protein Rab-17-like n=1 Tax=Megalops cyprinoides TaxID=118141 RepID=UPI001864C5BF|nr:ras-related protein Rab-17-like [Megalops cyprinoides]
MAERRGKGAGEARSDPRGKSGMLRVKMVLLGSSGVGKSSLALRFSKDDFKDSAPTVGCAYLTQLVCLHDATLRFEIWDTAGQEKYHSVTPLYYRGAHAALIVYDISNRESFMRAQLWLKELEKQYIPGETVVGLVANKSDLSSSRQVSQQEGRSLAENKGLLFMETSAKSGNQVSELLLDIAHRVKRSSREDKGLAEWREADCVDMHREGRPSPLSSCCLTIGL